MVTDDATRSVAIKVPIKRGPVVTFESIKVDPVGLNGVITEVARRCGVAPGARYSETNLMLVKSMLRENNNLNIVIATTDIDLPDRVNVSFEVLR
jgi:hypothetical protein